MKNFAIIGAAGFVAPRHLKAIYETKNQLVAALDPHDAVGVLDQYFPNAQFFTEFERFDRFLEKLRHKGEEDRVHCISICTPNYLHDAHIRAALRLRADAICEKPLVINPWNLDALADLETEFGQRVYTVLQLRLSPAVIALKSKLASQPSDHKPNVVLTYITRRGNWYGVSWKGNLEKSGGIALNIGVHFFDLLVWLFGTVESSNIHLSLPNKMSGFLELQRARVSWFLSIDADDLPENVRQAQKFSYRSLTLDGDEIEISEGFTDLHTKLYSDILSGNGFGIEDARPSIELVYNIRNQQIAKPDPDEMHPWLRSKKEN